MRPRGIDRKVDECAQNVPRDRLEMDQFSFGEQWTGLLTIAVDVHTEERIETGVVVSSVVKEEKAAGGMWDAGRRPRGINMVVKLQASLFQG
jgi:hypothetical protein